VGLHWRLPLAAFLVQIRAAWLSTARVGPADCSLLLSPRAPCVLAASSVAAPAPAGPAPAHVSAGATAGSRLVLVVSQCNRMGMGTQWAIDCRPEAAAGVCCCCVPVDARGKRLPGGHRERHATGADILVLNWLIHTPHQSCPCNSGGWLLGGSSATCSRRTMYDFPWQAG
jgi:hypothetical protein